MHLVYAESIVIAMSFTPDSIQKNIAIEQVVMGREFQGEAFKPTPALVLFKDFEVGQSYSQVITLTNISLARNTFKASHCLRSRCLSCLEVFTLA